MPRSEFNQTWTGFFAEKPAREQNADEQSEVEPDERGAVSPWSEEPSKLETYLERVGHSVQTFWGPIVILDLLLGVTFMLAGYTLPAALPGAVFASALVVLIGAFRPATLRVTGGGMLFTLGASLILYLVVISEFNGQPWTQRITKFTVLLLLASVLATGRINIRSFVIGGCAGALINVPLFYAGLTQNNYPPYLTGFYGDKNVAGMYYAMWGALGLLACRSRKTILIWVAASGVLLFLTGSRTSIAAYIGALGWTALRNRVGVSYRVVIASIGFGVLLWSVDTLAKASVWGDRVGDDWYRGQVEKAMQAKEAITPWYGLGLNEGQVTIGTRTQWFHDSYSQAFVEGGYLNVIIVVGAFVLLGVGLFDRRLRISRELLVTEGAMIAMLICAWKLGEALMTPASFIVLGIAIAYRLGQPRERFQWGIDPAPKLRARSLRRTAVAPEYAELRGVARGQ